MNIQRNLGKTQSKANAGWFLDVPAKLLEALSDNLDDIRKEMRLLVRRLREEA